MEAPSSPGLSPGPGEPRAAFRKPAHDTSQRNYRRRSPSASTSPSPPPAGGWKRDRSASPAVPAGDGGITRPHDHSKKERRLNAENDGHRDADPSRFRKGDSAPGPSGAPHRGPANDSLARPDDHDHSRRGYGHYDRNSSHSTYSGRDLHGEARIDYLSRQDGKFDDRSQDRGYRGSNIDRRRGKDHDRERDRNRNRDRETGREAAWDRSRERERDRDRERGRDWVRNADADRDRDKDRSKVEKARLREKEQLKGRDDYRDRERRRDRSHKDVDDNRERQDEPLRDRVREKSDQRDRAVRVENREIEHHRQVSDSRRQTRPREREDHGFGHHSRRPLGSERSGKGTENFSRSSEQDRDACGGGSGWDRRAGNNGPTSTDGEMRAGCFDGQPEEEKQGKLTVEGVKDSDANGSLKSEHSGERKTSPLKAVVGDVRHDTPRPESVEPGEIASTSHAPTAESTSPQLESKKSAGEAKSSKSSKWGPEANLKTDTPAASTDVNNDLSIAKLAALKAAEMVNKNLGVAGVMSADQKKKLLWGSKRKESEQSAPNQEPAVLAGTNRWDTVHFADRDRQEKFHKLMGVKGDHKEGEREVGVFTEEKQRELQQDLEKIYTAGLRRRDGRTVGLGL